jgi:hypothetical protein
MLKLLNSQAKSIGQDNTVKKSFRSSEEILNKETRQCLPGFI